MQQSSVLAMLSAVALGLLCSAAPVDASDAAFDELLAKYVKAGSDGVNRVDYTGWKASPGALSQLNEYIAELVGRLPSQMTRTEAFAYWPTSTTPSR